MKVYVRGELINSKEEAVVLLFEDNEDLKCHATNMYKMESKDSVRIYAVFPETISEEELRTTISEAKDKHK